jgi:hypothetical protein
VDAKDYLDVYRHPSPFVTLYLNTDGAVPQAAQRFDTRWKDVMRELAEQGVDAGTRDALDAARGESPHLRGKTLVMVASDGHVHLTRHLPQVPRSEVVRVDALPHLLPLIDQDRLLIPHILVLIDREGADIFSFRGAVTPASVTTVDAEHHPVHKTGTGGWSALRYEHKVEEGWKASARDVAERVVATARQLSARLVIVAGDQYARNGLVDALPEDLAEHVVVVPGGRSVDGSEAETAEAVIDVLKRQATDETRDVLARFAQYRGREEKVAHGASVGAVDQAPALKAADGIAESVLALRESRVECLLLTSAADPGAVAFFGPEPLALATDAGEAQTLGMDDAQPGPLVDVLVRAALAGDAQVIVTEADQDGAPAEGVGCLLRY